MTLDVTDFLSQEEILLQLAEEASELSQAALKLRRVMNGSNPTPVGFQEARKNLTEEIADVQLCIDIACIAPKNQISQIQRSKHSRWLLRLIEARKKEDDRAWKS